MGDDDERCGEGLLRECWVVRERGCIAQERDTRFERNEEQEELYYMCTYMHWAYEGVSTVTANEHGI